MKSTRFTFEIEILGCDKLKTIHIWEFFSLRHVDNHWISLAKVGMLKWGFQENFNDMHFVLLFSFLYQI
jgi:hypothetical protein